MANSLNKITTKSILNATVATADIAADAVTGAKIADDAIDSEHIANGALDSAHIASGTGFQVGSSNIENDAVIAAKIADDAVGAEHIEVLDSHLQLADNCNVKIGTGDDLKLHHDGTSSYITNTTSRLDILSGTGIGLWNADASEAYLKTAENGAVELYNDNVKCLETGSNTVKVNNRLQIHADAPGSGHGLSLGQWDGSNHRLEGDANRPIFITSYNSGGVKLGVSGTNEVTVTGDGLTFNGDTAAANALDDYEEGTWTPAMSANVATSVGIYTKVGRVVHIGFYVSVDSNSSSSAMVITGLPFTALNSYGNLTGSLSATNFGSAFLFFTNNSADGIHLRNYSNISLLMSDFSTKWFYGTATYMT